MANTASQSVAGMYGSTPLPAQANVSVDQDDEVVLPGPIEVYPGVMFDPKKADELPKEKTFFGLFDTPSSEAFSETTPQALAQSQELFEAARIDRLTPKAQEYGVNVDPRGTEVSNLISASGAQKELYLADTDEQYFNAMEKTFGKGNVRMIKDDGPNLSMFAPRNYVSVKRDDGTYTDFAPATVGAEAMVERYAPGVLAETGASLAIVPAAFATSAATAAVSGPLAVVTAPIMFGYTLYVGGKSVEAGRQYLQDELGLNKEEALQFSGTLDLIKELTVPEVFQAGEATEAEKQREIAGALETAFALIPGLKDKMKLAIGSVRSKGQIKPTTYESAVRAQETVAETAAGGAMDIGIPLENLMLQQVSPNRLIGRVASLAEQTSLIIPLKTQEQMQSVVSYLKKYGDNVGEGDFKKFQQDVAGIGQTLKSVQDAPVGERPDLTTIGENLGSLEDLFLRLRAVEARGLYSDVFDKVKNSSYNLDDIRAFLPENTTTIIPVTPADATKLDKTTIAADLPPEVRGERLMSNLMDSLITMGKVQKDGTRQINPSQIRAAVKKFAEDNPGFNFDAKSVDSPAKILQLYASRYGELARDTFGTAGTATNPKLFGQAMEMRNALLDLIGKPVKPIDGVADNLAKANNFYKETFELTGTGLQTQARIGRRSTETPEPATLAEQLTTVPGGGGRALPATVTMENINAQEAYVRQNIDKIDPSKTGPEVIGAATDLKNSFASVLSSKLARMNPTDLADVTGATDVTKFLDSFEPRQLRALGIDEAQEAQIRNDATLIANLQRGGSIDQVLGAPQSGTMAEVFETALSGDSAQIRASLNELLAVGRRQATPEGKEGVATNLREGLLNFIISPQSGVLKEVSSKSPYADIGQQTIDVAALQKVMTKLKSAGVFKDILNETDEKVLDAITEYAGVVTRDGADAGSALAGAQIIGEMFTVDPGKFASGLARLASQARVARLLANDEFVKAVTGTGKAQTTADKLKQMFFGSGAYGTLIAKVAMEGMGIRESDADQTERMLQNSSAASQSVQGMYGTTNP